MPAPSPLVSIDKKGVIKNRNVDLGLPISQCWFIPTPGKHPTQRNVPLETSEQQAPMVTSMRVSRERENEIEQNKSQENILETKRRKKINPGAHISNLCSPLGHRRHL